MTLFSYRKGGCCNNRSGTKMAAFSTCTSFCVSYRSTIYSLYVRSMKKKHNKNAKIQQWRFEVGTFEYTIPYRPGLNNYAADLFSRIYSSIISALLQDFGTL